MNDFVFVDDLTIRNNVDSLFSEETEESLRAELVKTDQELAELRSRISQIEKDKQELLDKLDKFVIQSKEIKLNAPSLSKSASLIEKAEFLYNLFYCRHDVFATRQWNRDKGHASYYPRCLKAWSPVCPLKIHKDNGFKGVKPDCSSCKERLYEQLTPLIIVTNQLTNEKDYGVDAIGIYPMLPGNKCRFLAIDLDEETWKKDSIAVATVARTAGFQIAIERSFSGNGSHLWLFFSEEIPAQKARKLAFCFLDEACRKSKTISLKSYDRVFPTQDSISDTGLGNLILMPLLKSAAKRSENKGTVFVDNEFNIYSDQIEFLSSLPKYSEKDVDLFLMQNNHDDMGFFIPYDDGGTDVLWSRKQPKLKASDCLSGTLPIYLSSGISIPKSAMSAVLQNSLKRMGCFGNPEYYRSVRRNDGYSSARINSFVQSYLESETVLQLPRGLLSDLKRYLQSNSISYEIIDYRKGNTKLNSVFTGSLRKEQISALNALKNNETGILRAATSFGKTVVAAALIAERKEKTLILVPSQSLLNQWQSSLERFLVVKNKPEKREGKRLNKTGIGLYGGSKDSISGFVDIATFQTIASRMPNFIREYGMVIADECHHVAADSFFVVMHAVCPRFVYGLSATVKREDGLEKLVYSQCGNIVYEYHADKLAFERGIVQYFVPRFTSSTISVTTGRKFNFTEAGKEIASNQTRNNLIVSDALRLLEEGKRILILTSFVEHSGILFKQLNQHGIKVVQVNGALSNAEKTEAWEFIRKGECDIIVSTGKYSGEGTDIPYLDTLMIVTPVSWEGIVCQYAGRIARSFSGKTETYIYDYVDICIPQFASMYTKRLSSYRKLGYIAKGSAVESSISQKGLFAQQSIFSQDTILDAFLNSVLCSKDSIVISSPQVYISSATKEICKEMINKHVHVRIITNTMGNVFNSSAQEEAIAYLESCGFAVETKPDCYLHYAVFDENEVWFGEINLLGGIIKKNKFRSSEIEQKSMIHIFDRMVASSLIEQSSSLINP